MHDFWKFGVHNTGAHTQLYWAPVTLFSSPEPSHWSPTGLFQERQVIYSMGRFAMIASSKGASVLVPTVKEVPLVISLSLNFHHCGCWSHCFILADLATAAKEAVGADSGSGTHSKKSHSFDLALKEFHSLDLACRVKWVWHSWLRL